MNSSGSGEIKNFHLFKCSALRSCGGYALCGHGHVYATPEASRDFSHEELKKAAAALKTEGIEVPIRAFYVTFGAGGENLVEEVTLS